MLARLVLSLAATGAAVLGLLVPTTGAAAAATSGAVHVEGAFLASVDFESLRTREVRGNKCELVVDGTLTFSGPVEGTATGTTTAVIFAPCADALSSPPGTYADHFEFEGQFTGEVLDRPASGPLRYAGVTRAGGGIDALITLRGDDARAVLRADARVAQGGTYRGPATSDA